MSHVAPCERRKVHDIDARYTIMFPFEDDPRTEGLHFEIDPRDGTEMYRTVGFHIPKSFRELEDTESDQDRPICIALGNISIRNEDSIANIVHSGSYSETTTIISKAAAGDVPGMEDLLSQSSNRQLLLNARQPGEEHTLLSVAVRHGHLKAVDFLIDNGVDVDAVDAKGRTPLMEAALWVRPGIVDRLLRAGASSKIRENSGKMAAQFAGESEGNDEERNRRHPGYSENPYLAKQDGKLIRGLLGEALSRSLCLKRLTLRDLDDAFFYKSAETNTISFITPSTGTYITSPSKTAAFLDRGSPFPVVCAISGFNGPRGQQFLPPGDGFEKLNCRYWMLETIKIARAFDFGFQSHGYDEKDTPGSFFAGHAESMLMCFFVKRNYIFRDYAEGSETDNFLQLFMSQPRKRGAHIIVSKELCHSCTTLRADIQLKLGIKFDLTVIETRIKGFKDGQTPYLDLAYDGQT